MSVNASRIALAVLDMGGTTIDESAVHDAALTETLQSVDARTGTDQIDNVRRYAKAHSGIPKIKVFEHFFGQRAPEFNRAFENAYDTHLAALGVQPIPGAEDAINALRERGLQICLMTGLARHTQNQILESLGWMGLADLSLCPSDAGRGRPYPDMILTAILALDINDVRQVMVVGDAPSDIVSGLRAGSHDVIGVPTGAHTETELTLAGAKAVVPSIRDIPAWLDTERARYARPA